MGTGTWRQLGWMVAVLLALAGCGGGSGSSLPTAVDEGRQAIRETMASTRATAVSVALVDHDRVAWAEAFGQADPATGAPATTATLFSAASVSKMLAASAVMVLADQGRIALDEPVATYVPAFRMPLDPRFRDITVRMLLCHTSGLPGNDPRGAVTLQPFPGYAAQVMAGLVGQRLKHEPGRLCSYNNDGFTMVENLVQAVTGQSYPAFVRQNLLAPLGMDTSRYQVEPLPEGSHAAPWSGAARLPLCQYNVYATGGLFATPTELGRLAAMFLGGGQLGGRRILTQAAVAAMGQDQRLGGFDPVPCSMFRSGLGWDTVAQPALAAVGVRAWQKGGDLEHFYGATLVVVPDEGLAVAVMGASNSFSSGSAGTIAERILLRALVERGRIPSMPARLTGTALAVQAPDPAVQLAQAGIYASGSDLYRASFDAGGVLTVAKYGSAWTTAYADLRLREDGWYASDADPLTGVRLLTRGGRAYLALRARYGYGNYQIRILAGQAVAAQSELSATWLARAADAWLPVNGDVADFLTSADDPSLRLRAVPGLPGYLKGEVLFRAFPAPTDEGLDGMFLDLPDGMRDLVDLAAESWNGETWLRMGSRLYRPRSTVPALAAGASSLVVGAEGFTEWRMVPDTGRVALSGARGWSLHDASLKQLATGTGDGAPALAGAAYLAVMGDPGATLAFDLQTP
jgi:CubicO group peptidase (beta-lactamase class C family)